MAARTKARKRALDLLFEAEQRGLNAADLLRERLAARGTLFNTSSDSELFLHLAAQSRADQGCRGQGHR